MLLSTAQPGPSPLAGTLMVIGIIGMGVLLTMSIRGKVSRRNASRPSPRDWVKQVKSAAAGRHDAEAQSARLVDLARRLSAQLDNKSDRLEILLQEADERIARLAGGAVEGLHTPPAAERATPPEEEPSNSTALDTLTRSVYDLADSGRSAIEIARALDEQIGKVELILALRAA